MERTYRWIWDQIAGGGAERKLASSTSGITRRRREKWKCPLPFGREHNRGGARLHRSGSRADIPLRVSA